MPPDPVPSPIQYLTGAVLPYIAEAVEPHAPDPAERLRLTRRIEAFVPTALVLLSPTLGLDDAATAKLIVDFTFAAGTEVFEAFIQEVRPHE